MKHLLYFMVKTFRVDHIHVTMVGGLIPGSQKFFICPKTNRCNYNCHLTRMRKMRPKAIYPILLKKWLKSASVLTLVSRSPDSVCISKIFLLVRNVYAHWSGTLEVVKAKVLISCRVQFLLVVQYKL